MNKKKKILICSLAFIIIVFLLIVVFLKTDLFKTKELLFWKYFLNEKDEVVNVFSNDDTKAYNNKLKSSYYIKEGNISISGEKTTLIKPISIDINKKGNKKYDCYNTLINIKYDDKDLNKTTIIKDNNYYLLKNDLISEDYIGIENNNLKQHAHNLGIKNTDFIPNKIKEIDYDQLFTLSDDEVHYILKKYIPICRKTIKNKHYIKEENKARNVSLYKLQVTEKQFNELVIDILDELYDDEISLNIISKKIKIFDEENKYCDIDRIRDKIDVIKDNLTKREASNDVFLSIIIYKNKNSVEKIDFIFNDRTFSIKATDNQITITQFDIKDNQIDLSTFNNIAKTVLNSINEITYKKEIKNDNTNKVCLNIKCNIGIDLINIKYNYVEQIKNNVENIIRKDEIDYKEIVNEDYNSMIKNTIKKYLQ